MQTKTTKKKVVARNRWYKFKTIDETIILTDGKEDMEKTLIWRDEQKKKLKRKYTPKKSTMTDKEVKSKAKELSELFSKGKIENKLERVNRKGKLGIKKES